MKANNQQKNKEKILCKQNPWLRNEDQYNKEDLRQKELESATS